MWYSDSNRREDDALPPQAGRHFAGHRAPSHRSGVGEIKCGVKKGTFWRQSVCPDSNLALLIISMKSVSVGLSLLLCGVEVKGSSFFPGRFSVRVEWIPAVKSSSST